MALRHSVVALPKLYRTLRLDTFSLTTALKAAPKEFSNAANNRPLIVVLPMPDGTSKKFRIVQTTIMEDGLRNKFSNIKTFGGQGIDDPSATIKIDWTELGFHAMIFSQTTGTVVIDPYAKESLVDYISYNKKDLPSNIATYDEGVLSGKLIGKSWSGANRISSASCTAGMLHQYRVAVACTGEYADSAVGSTQVTTAQALSAIVTTINRVDGVYESELGIRLILVSNNDKIVFTNPAAQPFTGNRNANILINESQRVIDSLIGSANYDIGHTFSTGAGGFAGVGVVGDNNAKAKGVTGLLHPVGDAFNIDYVSHEMGHQFGANHTFNATTGNCGGSNTNSATNAEPGSGSTIMAYAGICGSTNNLQPYSIPYFHAVSFDEITNFITTGNGSLAGTIITTNNHAPVVNAGGNYNIPKATPFALTGSAFDADGDPLTYSWEQANVQGPFTDWNKPLGDAPIFRSFAPVNTPVRYFPQVTDLVNNKTTIGEILPSYARTLKFRLTARDNHLGGAGVCSGETSITVDGTSGPFVVTAPNTSTTWNVGTFNFVTWDVAKTNLTPVNCKNVNIELSVDGGLTFPITLASNTPNDGSEEILVPSNITSSARIRVISAGNIFFDISNENFAITAVTDPGFTFNNPLPVAACNNTPAATIIKSSSFNKFSTPVTLSATGNPAGSSVVFGANPVNPGSTDSIMLRGNVPPGMYNITVTGTAGSLTVSRTIVFIIGSPTTVTVNNATASTNTSPPLLPIFSWKTTADAQFYSLNISTSSSFTSMVQSIDNIGDTSYMLTTPLTANTTHYWRVVPYNGCGSGPASVASQFKTPAVVCNDIVYSTNVPIVIDTIRNTIVSTLNIPAGGIIQNLNVVGLKGTHTYVSDLTISIISPSGTKVQLLKGVCGGNQDFDLSFDDQALNILQCPINDGQVSKPAQALTVFNNENSTGTWKLEVVDGYDEDGGTLNSWGLKICTYQPSALPVNWVTFTGNKNNDKTVGLEWTVANQIDNQYYNIEKSADGVNFNYIGKVEAQTSPAKQQYLFKDVKPYTGDNFYRLKQVDKDGRYSYSKVIKLSFDASPEQYMVYPNPAIDKSTIRVLADTKQLSIQLTNALGKTVYKRSTESVKAGQAFEIPVKGFGKGLYILTLLSEKGITNEKIVIQ
ncbi:MAG: M12 family metallo-peptidase [Bacteroidota bacterium]|nr:M12 family metallo-peptidase [Bacteroidota bacterium]